MMPSIKDMAEFRDADYSTHTRWYWALQAALKANDPETAEWVRHLPNLIVSKWVTAACLLHMDLAPAPIFTAVVTEYVKQRLS